MYNTQNNLVHLSVQSGIIALTIIQERNFETDRSHWLNPIYVDKHITLPLCILPVPIHSLDFIICIIWSFNVPEETKCKLNIQIPNYIHAPISYCIPIYFTSPSTRFTFIILQHICFMEVLITMELKWI